MWPQWQCLFLGVPQPDQKPINSQLTRLTRHYFTVAERKNKNKTNLSLFFNHIISRKQQKLNNFNLMDDFKIKFDNHFVRQQLLFFILNVETMLSMLSWKHTQTQRFCRNSTALCVRNGYGIKRILNIKLI
jgi:hypothetical protein